MILEINPIYMMLQSLKRQLKVIMKVRFNMSVLEVTNLQKSFGNIRAVQDISFSVREGEVFTIIGPNGAGKTTTLEMIEGLVPPDQGNIHFG